MTFPSSDPESPPPPLVYQVNASSFSHQWLQADKDDSYMVNGTFADCIAADQSAPSMKFEVGDEMQKWDHDVGNIPPAERFDNGGTEMEQDEDEDDEDDGEIINLCGKSDGKGWQCRRKAKEGHSLCEHHSSHQVNKASNSAHSVGKKSEKASESRRRPRPKKPSTLSSNPNEYYYYSGFGPRWGKKRGPAAATKAEPYTSSGGSEASRNDVELVVEPNTPQTNHNNASAAEENFPFPRSSRMDIEGFDYIEDDDDDDEEEVEEDDEIGQTEKKRARKPIKARSLKSLM